MGGKIPRPIRVQAIRSWLEGKSRDKIAEEIGISTGAVSSIIKDFRRDDPHFDLLREAAVKIKNLNMDIQSFAPLVRVYEVLREKELLTGIIGQESLELMQDRMEALIVALEVFCFKKEQLSIEDFVSLITNMYNTADKLGVPLDRLPAHITELGDRIDALRGELDQLEAKKQDALRDNEATAELLQEYNANKPFIQQIRNLRQQLAEKEEEIAEKEEEVREAKNELETEKLFEIVGEQITWRVSLEELDEASIGLGLSRTYNIDNNPHLEVRDLREWVMDVFYHPNKYINPLRQIRDIYNSQRQSTTAA
jgi:transcriptional regulator with XRE-family HTH domain